MPRRSFRTVLTAWNAVVLAGLLAILGAAIVVTNQNRIRAQIDDDLLHQATMTARAGPPPPPPRGFERFPMPVYPGRPGAPMPTFPARPDRAPDFGGPPGSGPFGPGPGPGVPQAPNGGPPDGPASNPYADAYRIADVRRPRFFDADGKAMHRGDPPEPFDRPALTAALAGHAGFSYATLDLEPIRVYTRPLVRDGRIYGAAQFARELSDLNLVWAAQLRTLAAVLPLAIIAAALAAYVLTGRTLQPVARLTATASEIGRSGDLSQRLEVTGHDEMATLARTFNEMLARLERSFAELKEALDKLGVAYEQQRRFAADASHELRTPLTRLRLATSAALAGTGDPAELRAALGTADTAAEAMSRLVEQLLMLARADAGQLGLPAIPLDLRVTVAEAVDQAGDGRTVETRFAERPVMACVDAGQVRRLVMNLVENALRHTPPSGVVAVETDVEAGEAVIQVCDTGEGIAPEHLPHVTERFYRVDPARTRRDGGAGLGLAICDNIARAHGGRLEITSRPGIGTTVRAIFPVFSAPEEIK